MSAKKNKKPGIRVLRDGEEVNPQSTQIRSDQAKRLRQEIPVVIKTVKSDDHVKLIRTPVKIFSTAGRTIECGSCRENSRTRRMFSYNHSSRGAIILCEICDENAEVRSFLRLDALDKVRKRPRVE